MGVMVQETDVGHTFRLVWGGAAKSTYFLKVTGQLGKHISVEVYVVCSGKVREGFIPNSRLPFGSRSGRKGELRVVFDRNRPAKQVGNGLQLGHGFLEAVEITDVTGTDEVPKQLR